MFTYVIVALVLTVIGLTAFWPRFREWVQWSFKKAAQVLCIAVTAVVVFFVEVLMGIVLIVAYTICGIGYLTIRFGELVLSGLARLDDRFSDAYVRVRNRIWRF